jgi:hypothetical protein
MKTFWRYLPQEANSNQSRWTTCQTWPLELLTSSQCLSCYCWASLKCCELHLLTVFARNQLKHLPHMLGYSLDDDQNKANRMPRLAFQLWEKVNKPFDTRGARTRCVYCSFLLRLSMHGWLESGFYYGQGCSLLTTSENPKWRARR